MCRLVSRDVAPSPRQRVDARALAAELGHFPLAIQQAGAYLAQNRGITLDAYRRKLGTKLGRTAHGADPERTLARIWNVTLHALEEANPQAVDLLYTVAWLAPDDIPHTLLTPPGSDPDDIAEAIGALTAYSMATDTGSTLSIHRLVQTVLRAPQDTDTTLPPRRFQGRDRAEQAVLHHLTPPPGEDTAPTDNQWDTLIPHLVAFAATTPPGHHNAPLTDAFVAAANRLHLQGHTARTIPLCVASLAQYEQVLGDTHPDTLNSRNNLACGYESAGDVGRAIPLFEAVLVQREQVLGDTHPDTLNSRNNLACGYESAGDVGRAIPLYEAVLVQREQVLGDTHPDTLNSRSNLAYAYRAAGDLGRAIALYEATSAQYERVMGDSHPSTLASRNSLARAYTSAGDVGRAIPLFEATLAQREQVLGDTHPSTLASRNDLAHAYWAAGDVGRAIALYEATLAQRERVMGDTHRSTLASRNNLAGAYASAGDLGRAIPLYEFTVAQCEQLLGDTHPNTLTSRNNLARARVAAALVQQPSTAIPATDSHRRRPSGAPEQPE